MADDKTNDTITEEVTDEDLEQQALEQEAAELEEIEGAKETVVESTETAVEETTKPAEFTPPTAEEFEKLKKSQQGIYESYKAEKTKRQANDDRLTNISDALLEIQTERANKVKEKQVAEAPKIPDRIKVEVDQETGDAYISVDQAKQILGGDNKAVDDRISNIQSQVDQKAAQDAADAEFFAVVDSVVQMDESFIPALPVMDKALNYLRAEVSRLAKQDVLSGRAIDIVEENEDVMNSFSEQFPGVSHRDILRAYDSKSDLREALKSIAGTMEKGDTVDTPATPKVGISASENLKKIAGVQSSIGTARNQKVSTGGIELEDYVNLDAEDFNNLSDAEIAKVERAVARAQDGEP